LACLLGGAGRGALKRSLEFARSFGTQRQQFPFHQKGKRANFLSVGRSSQIFDHEVQRIR
jgi:hypothetical protein